MDDKIISELINLNKILVEYYHKIEEEYFDNISNEMISDLKCTIEESILNSKYYKHEMNYFILENYHNIRNVNNKNKVLESINDISNNINKKILTLSNTDIILENNIFKDYELVTEGLVSNITKSLSNIKSNFGNKHDKLVERDKKWLKDNKKNILNKDYNEIELEILSDNKVTFEGLLNRHNIFDKIFVNSSNTDDLDSKLRRFEDKNGNLKNGLDNYFKTGTSRREIGLRKVSGEDAKTAVENMIEYCESFLAGKSYLEEKINNIIISVNESQAKESYEYISPYRTYSLQEALEDDDDIDKYITDDTEGFKDEENNDKDPKDEEDPNKETRGLKDRQTGVAVLMTVAEERYFDYINILKQLAE